MAKGLLTPRKCQNLVAGPEIAQALKGSKGKTVVDYLMSVDPHYEYVRAVSDSHLTSQDSADL